MINKDSWINILSFLLGIFIINIIGSDLLKTYGVISFWNNQITMNVRLYDQYFVYIILYRLKILLFLFCLNKIVGSNYFVNICSFGFCFLMGGFFTMAILNRGMMGVVIAVTAVLPHWILYVAAFLIYKKIVFKKKTDRYTLYSGHQEVIFTKKNIFIAMLIVMLILAGCLLESYLSPILLEKVLKS